MKKGFLVLFMLAFLVLMAACDSGGKTDDVKEPEVTIDGIQTSIQTLDPDFVFGDDKPIFELIGAKDGWIAYLNGTEVVKVYQYENEEAYNQAVESMPQMKDWPKNGLFVLECNNENVKAVFLGEEVQSADPGDSEESDADAISVGETITTDTMEITINKAELSYDVLPDQKPDFYSHYPAEVGKVFIHLDVDVKNLAKQALSCDEIMTVTADYNGGYTYNGFEVVEDSFSGFTYSNITSIAPLDTLGVHYLIECPQEVEESTNPLFLTLKPFDAKQSYLLTMR